ncbi:MAG: hypothetical protein ACRCSG_09345 [Cellulosilyticaceae bacterium]
MIVDSLKQYEPFSIPFLHKVSKRDVPNYYDHVKTPMDLATLQRNIKKYDRATFKHDLDLIWDNCVFFNGPSIYTDYAEKMRERANYLWNYLFIRNVTIKNSEDPNYFLEKINLSEDIVNEEIELDVVEYKYQKLIDLGHFSKRIRYSIDAELGNYESKRILEQVVIVLIGAMGYKKISVMAVRILSDIVYNLIYTQCCKMEDGHTKEMSSLSVNDLIITKLPSDNSIDEKDDTTGEGLEEDVEIKDEISCDEYNVEVSDENIVIDSLSQESK